MPATPGSDERHRWAFDGDDPYIVCPCGEYRDALTGRVIREGDGTHAD